MWSDSNIRLFNSTSQFSLKKNQDRHNKSETFRWNTASWKQLDELPGRHSNSISRTADLTNAKTYRGMHLIWFHIYKDWSFHTSHFASHNINKLYFLHYRTIDFDFLGFCQGLVAHIFSPEEWEELEERPAANLQLIVREGGNYSLPDSRVVTITSALGFPSAYASLTFPTNAVITTEYLVNTCKSFISIVLFSSFDFTKETLKSSLSTYGNK